MKKRKTVCYIFIAFVMIILAGCGYTKEEDIAGTFTQELEKITGLSAKSVFICYGEFQTVNAEKNGMVHDFYNGGNLTEILQGGSARAVASYINQPVEQIPVSEISRMTGVQTKISSIR